MHPPTWQCTATGAAKTQSDISTQDAQTSLDWWPVPQKVASETIYNQVMS